MRELAEADVAVVGTLHVVGLVSMCPGLLENASAFVAAGGTLLYGSDYGVPGIPGGVDVTELELLAESGLGAMGALRAATLRAGELLPGEPLGRLVEGSVADLVAVRGDPTQDLDALAEPLLIVVRGRIELGG
jgi:imidazolonepropionase-like amidohydrolase